MPDGSASIRRRMSPADRAHQLLRTAEEVFSEIGFHAATMEVIAQRAGVSRTVLYQHYSTKDDLAAASLRGSRKALSRIVAAAGTAAAGTAGDGPYRRLRRTLREVMAFISHGGELYSALLADNALSGSSARAEAETIRHDMEQTIARVLREIDPTITSQRMQVYARSMVGAGERVAQSLAGRPASSADTDRLADTVLDLVWNGIRPRADVGN